ncbi:MAG: hypothetical protein WC781_02625 [Candidatus Pacearchaeota archaeon]|jgi:hypothetical protein
MKPSNRIEARTKVMEMGLREDYIAGIERNIRSANKTIESITKTETYNVITAAIRYYSYIYNGQSDNKLLMRAADKALDIYSRKRKRN